MWTLSFSQNLERSLGTMEMRLQELQAPTPFVGNLAECGDGVATWCIPQFSQIRRAAVNGGQTFIDSPPFMTGSYGYKMKMRLFPDGDNAAKGNALSVYLHLLPGPCDDLLPWPFQADVSQFGSDIIFFFDHLFNENPTFVKA